MTCPPISDTWAWKPSCHAGRCQLLDLCFPQLEQVFSHIMMEGNAGTIAPDAWYRSKHFFSFDPFNSISTIACTIAKCTFKGFMSNRHLAHFLLFRNAEFCEQGKSMPRKRKYVDPAGSNAAYAAQLPPQHVQQPYSRVRQPGDKWLKTATSDSGSADVQNAATRSERFTVSNSYRYQSVRDTHNQHMDDTSSAGTVSPTNSANSDVVELSQQQKEDIERNLGLQQDEIQIYCFEDHQKALTQACEKAKKLSSYEAVVSFEAPDGFVAPSKENAKSNKEPIPSAVAEISMAISSPTKKSWWWHRPGAMGSDESGQRYDSSSESSQAAGVAYERCQWQTSDLQGFTHARVKVEDTQVKLEGNSAAALYPAHDEPVVNAPLDGSRFPAQASVSPDSTPTVENGKGAKRKLQFHQGGKSATAPAEGGVKPKAKRMWRRWEPTEDEALKRAVRMHGTKDWVAIQTEMRTDRSIKQLQVETSASMTGTRRVTGCLQDHWNDLKHDRKHNKS
eukprot:765260-Hanusia_phi.AAC.1